MFELKTLLKNRQQIKIENVLRLKIILKNVSKDIKIRFG
jgi:hypothetical protein